MLDLKNKTIWPFSKEEFFLIAIGRLIENEKLISIDDLPTILALNKMGFFGAHSSREIIFKSMIDTQNKRQQQSTNKNKPKFTVGFFSLNTVNISPALTNFIGDTNVMLLFQLNVCLVLFSILFYSFFLPFVKYRNLKQRMKIQQSNPLSKKLHSPV